MKRILSIFFSLILLSLVFPVQAQENSFSSDTPAILPHNPFYFLKNWSSSMSVLFAESNPEKAIAELKLLNERAEEILLMQRYQGSSEIGKASSYYVDQAKKLSNSILILSSADLEQSYGFSSSDAFLGYFLNSLVKHLDFSEKLILENSEEDTQLILETGKIALTQALEHIRLNFKDESKLIDQLHYIVAVEDSSFAKSLIQEIWGQ